MKVLMDGTVTAAQGFSAGAVACGLKKAGQSDLMLVYSERPCTAAGVFTKNEIVAAPVIVDRETLASNGETIHGIAANAGNANACTGQEGMTTACAMQEAAADAYGQRSEEWLILSTGVIGVQLPLDKVKAGIQEAAGSLSADGGMKAAEAIMTTDTRPKHIAVEIPMPDGTITIGGIAKGSGMIHPNMATMLGIVTTDAAVPSAVLQKLLTRAVNQSFNCISVDGDTSTNDTVLLLANGESGVEVGNGDALALFEEGLDFVCTELAKMIVRDGEGATKLAEIQITGAFSPSEAKKVAQTVATSPLVKTALAGSDANWGRIVAAAGRAGVPLKAEQLALWVSTPGEKALKLLDRGGPTDYAEVDAAAVFAGDEIIIRLDLGDGEGEATMWTCDLTHEYVTINADYRT
ncbi:MAG: bifunctional glutamate N-acetyltransferase/amino-acid acetyltransferase ArgJ [Candidatus Promineifilaceae bacterium]